MRNTTHFQVPSPRNLFARDSTSVPQVNYGKSVNKDLDGELDDGYSWRKYGEKEVKRGENPRYYYMCTHPNCTMKKKVGRNSNGDVIEVIYKGSHNHPKPWKPLGKFQSLDAPTSLTNLGNMSQQSPGEQDLARIIERASRITSHPRGGDEDQLGAHAKRLKGVNEVYSYSFYQIGGKAIKEPRVIVQTTTEIDILDDGYRWRKYGQKLVKGNPNPRNYYKCVSEGCNVRKHVERAAHDMKCVLTTYEGKHNHQVPEQPSFPTQHISFTPLTSLNNFAATSSPSVSNNNQNSESNQQTNNLPLRIGGIPNFGRSLIGGTTSYANNEGPTSNNNATAKSNK
ncbi:hypothetical protein PIB30_023457 [Stylosanthes scabra]|uniref:WRKY domain-containing protein n=1 Tax=Stylosanthes scabra TaxID=79078 RepID=A0ABU6Q9Y0_9FABA|nr:hypothetical protein [Stylosanthes scabra]